MTNLFWESDEFKQITQHAKSYLGGIKTRSCLVDDYSWKYLEIGKGDVILCLHGIGSSKSQWRTFMTSMAPKYRLICPDIPALSLRVELPIGQPTKRKLVEWLIGYLNSIDVGQVHIAAHGSGGILASHFVQEQSERVKTFAWFNPPDLERIKAGDMAVWEKAKSGFGSIQEATYHLDQFYYRAPQYPEVFKRLFMTRVKKAFSDGKFVELMEKELELIPVLLTKLRAIKQPTLLVAADHDVMSSIAWVEKLVALIPNCDMQVLKKCGQFSLHEKTDELVDIYASFLARN